MIAVPPTQAEDFETYKVSPASQMSRYSDVRAEINRLLIQDYQARGFVLFPLPRHMKRPFKGHRWSEEEWTYEGLLAHVDAGSNLALIAGASGVAVIDVDHAELPAGLARMVPQTLTMRTPRGWAFFVKPPVTGMARLLRRFPQVDTPRVDVMYELVPPSVTCARCRSDPDADDYCKGSHDWRFRVWASDAPVLPGAEFVKRALKA